MLFKIELELLEISLKRDVSRNRKEKIKQFRGIIGAKTMVRNLLFQLLMKN